MGGFFGVVSKAPCANTIFYGTDYHSHMGNKRAGLATMNEQGIVKRSIHSIENSYFRNKFEDELGDFTGNRGFGVISDRDPQPIVLRSHLGTFAIVTVGKINNLEELGNELLKKGINFSELSTGQINATELVGHLITLGKTFAEGIRLVQDKVQGSCSMLILTQDGIIAARDKYGRTPIAVGIRCSNGYNPATDAAGGTGGHSNFSFGKAEVGFGQPAGQAGEGQPVGQVADGQPAGQAAGQAEGFRAEQAEPAGQAEGFWAEGQPAGQVADGQTEGQAAAEQAEPEERPAELVAVAFASESCSFPNLDFQLAGFLGPGEAVLVQESPEFCAGMRTLLPLKVREQLVCPEQFIGPDKLAGSGNKDAWRSIPEIHQILPPGEKLQICSFLWVYYGFPTSAYEGINVEEVRFRNGKLVGESDDTEVDAVCSIPDSGTGMAMGYAVGKGVPYRQAVAKYTPTWPRSFTPNDQERRKLVARMKLLPNSDVLNGSKMVCCDDSIVRGTQLKNNVQVLFRNGVKEIHARISCPPIINTCPFLSFTNTRAEMELVTRRVIEKLQSAAQATAGNGQSGSSDVQSRGTGGQSGCFDGQAAAANQLSTMQLKFDTLQEFVDENSPEHRAMVEEICKEMGFTSLKYSSIMNLIESIGLPKKDLCTYCFDGAGCGE